MPLPLPGLFWNKMNLPGSFGTVYKVLCSPQLLKKMGVPRPSVGSRPIARQSCRDRASRGNDRDGVVARTSPPGERAISTQICYMTVPRQTQRNRRRNFFSSPICTIGKQPRPSWIPCGHFIDTREYASPRN